MKIKMIVVTAICALAAFSFPGCQKKPQTPPGPPTIYPPKGRPITLNAWMTALPDRTSLSELSIPGTHDSGARFEPSPGTAKTQDNTIAQQLANGIRFLDIRCRHIGNVFAIHHGEVFQNQFFGAVLQTCVDFLKKNPGECIIMSVKQEHRPEKNTRSFEATFDDYVKKHPGRWYLADKIPALGEARGKIVLLRRFGASGNLPKGMHASPWKDNATFTIDRPGAKLKLRIQDQYEVSTIANKWNAVDALLNEAKSASPGTLFINFTSGYRMIWGLPNIKTVDYAINDYVRVFFNDSPKGRYGIIAMDFERADRNRSIINKNF